jgi:hypothetical protein
LYQRGGDKKQRERNMKEARRINSRDVRAKKYGYALQVYVPKMPTDPV